MIRRPSEEMPCLPESLLGRVYFKREQPEERLR